MEEQQIVYQNNLLLKVCKLKHDKQFILLYYDLIYEKFI